MVVAFSFPAKLGRILPTLGSVKSFAQIILQALACVKSLILSTEGARTKYGKNPDELIIKKIAEKHIMVGSYSAFLSFLSISTALSFPSSAAVLQ